MEIEKLDPNFWFIEEVLNGTASSLGKLFLVRRDFESQPLRIYLSEQISMFFDTKKLIELNGIIYRLIEMPYTEDGLTLLNPQVV